MPAVVLERLDLVVKRGDLVAIVGPVGSGKSSLLASLSGEMQLLEGSVAARRGCRSAYASQVPWIINAT